MDLLNNRYRIIANFKGDLTNSLFLVSDLLKDNKKLMLKILKPEVVSQNAVDYLKRDFISLTSLSHPNLMELYSFNILDSVDRNYIASKQFFCTYEYVKGNNIFDASSEMNFEGIVELIIQVCRCLHYLHSRGYVYKNLDVKNIYVTENINKHTVKLTGIAANEEIEKVVFNLKKSGHQFRAPETLSSKEPSVESDLYSLGVLIFYLLSRKNPARNNFSTIWSYSKDDISNFKHLPKNIDGNKLTGFINKLTSKSLEERYRDISEVVKAINEITGSSYSCFEKKPLEKIITKTRLIGREDAFEQLLKWKDKYLNLGSGTGITCISGETGIGKSRFLKEFSFHLSLDKYKIFNTLSSENEKITYEPVLQILKKMLPLTRIEILEKYGPELIKILPDGKYFKDVKPSPALSDEKEKLRLKVRIANFISDSLEGEPSVIIFDNAQWIDDATLELIDYIINSIKQNPLWIILSYREEELKKNKQYGNYIDKWKASGILNEMSLPRFNIEETGSLIKSLLGISSTPVSFCTEIFKDTDGNPGFIVDTLTALFAEKKLYIDEKGQWSTNFDSDTDYSRLYLPSSMHEAVWAHINTLNQDSYGILELLSVFNIPASIEVLMRITTMDKEYLNDILATLISHQLIDQKADERGYIFDFHTKRVKKEVYEKIEASRKIDFHRKSAAAFEEIFRKENSENKDELIYHLIKAKELKMALELIIESADRMYKLHINAQALAYLKKGLQISKEISSVRSSIKILLLLGELYRRKGENNNAFDCYFEILKTAVEIDDKITIAKVKEMIGALYTRKNEFDKALEILNESLELSKEIGYSECYLETVRRICWIYIFKRRNNESIELITDVLIKYGSPKYTYYHAELYNVLGTHYLELSNIQEALNCYNQSINLFEKIGERVEIAYPLNNIATVFAEFLHDNAKAREYFQKSLEINMANNLVEGISSCYDNLGETCRLEDNYTKALEYYFKCEEQATESELNSLLFTVYKNIMLAYLELDEYQKSYDYLLKIKNEIEKNPDRGLDLQVYCEYAAKFYYEIGSFKEGKTLSVNGINAASRDGAKEILVSESMQILNDYAGFYSSNHHPDMSLVNQMDNLLKSYGNTNMVKEKREIIHAFAEALIESGESKKALLLLKESKALSSRINTDRLEIECLYLEGLCSGGPDGIKTIEKAMELNEKYQSLRLKWKGYKAIGDIYFTCKEKHLSAAYYTRALDVLYELAQRVPKEYQRVFLYSHNRNIPRERLLNIKSEYLKGQASVTEKLVSKHIQKSDNILQFFFGGLQNESYFSFDGSNNTSKAYDCQETIFDNSVNKIKNVLTYNSNDYKQNLRLIINTACDLTSAETGYILWYNDKNELEVLASYDKNFKSNYYEYVIEHAREKAEGFFSTDTFGKRAGNINIMLPGDIKAIMCIPICERDTNENDKYLINKRVSIEKSGLAIKGYMYLSTRAIFNTFTWESYDACKILANQASFQMEIHYLKIISSIDKLTGVYTRKYFESVFEVQLKKAHREKSPFSIIMADIDKFKSINDNYGHQKGDEILSNIGKILLDNVRTTDICCRYGGEEFIILLPNTDIPVAEIIAERLRFSVEKAHLMGQSASLTISLGISSYPKHGEWRDELIGKADQALYHAKESGRNRYCFWNTKMRKLTKRMDKLSGIITGNIAADQKNVLAILELIQLTNENISLQDKIYRSIGILIEIFDADYGMLLTFAGRNKKASKSFIRQRTLPGWVHEENYNKRITDKVIKSKNGMYMVDWENTNDIDPKTGEPILHSILTVPLISEHNVNALIYLSCPIIRKEFNSNDYNFLSTLTDIIKGIILKLDMTE